MVGPFSEQVAKMSILKDGQKSIRVVLPEHVYERLKNECPSHGDMSKLIRQLLIKYLSSLEEYHQAHPTEPRTLAEFISRKLEG